MKSAFGVDHDEVSKRAPRDYSRAREKYQRKANRAGKTENVGQAIGGAAGASLGAAALRDAAFREHPGFQRNMQLRSMDIKPPKLAEALMHGRPGFKGMAVAAAGAGTAAVARRSKKHAEKKVVRYSVTKALEEPGGAMHAHDLEIAKRMKSDEATLRRHKKMQGALGATAASTGLLALSAKTGAKALPKLMKETSATGKAAAYQRHLDKTANALLFGASGVGGASGLHQSAIYRAESRQKKPVVKSYRDKVPSKEEVGRHSKKVAVRGARLALATQTLNPTGVPAPKVYVARKLDRKLANVDKAFDPERSRRRRSKVYEGAAATGSAGAAALALRPAPKDRKAAKKLKHSRDSLGAQRVTEGMRQVRQGQAEMSYRHNMTSDEAVSVKQSAAHKPHGTKFPTPRPLRSTPGRGTGMKQAYHTVERGAQNIAEGQKQLLETPKVPTRKLPRGKLAAAAVGSAGAAVAIHRHRSRGGRPYGNWYS